MISIIDADLIPYYVCHYLNPGLDEDLNSLIYYQILSRFIPTNQFIAFMSKGKSFRHKLRTRQPYKGKRKKEKPENYIEVRQQVLQDLSCIEVEDIEADDAISITARYYNPDCVVVSTDKDLNQIPGKHFNPNTQEFYHVTTHQAKVNLWTQVLTGDSTDSYIGVRGIGKVRAAKILESLNQTKDYYYKVLDVFKNHYNDKGDDYFKESFKLAYILERYPNFKIPNPIVYDSH